MILVLHNEIKEACDPSIAFPDDFEGFPNEAEINGQLNMHLQMIDLLGLCSKGHNFITESYCRKKISYHRVLDVILDDRLSLYLKIPYMRFTEGVYFSIEELDEKLKRKMRNFDDINIVEILMTNEKAKFISLLRMFTDCFSKVLTCYHERRDLIVGETTIDKERERVMIAKEDLYNYCVFDVVLPLIGDLFSDNHIEEICRMNSADGQVIGEDDIQQMLDDADMIDEDDDAKANDDLDLEPNEEEMKEEDDNEGEGDEEAEEDEEEGDNLNFKKKIRKEEEEQVEEIDEFDNAETKEILDIVTDWVKLMCKMAQNHLITANESRRDALLDCMEEFKSHNKVGVNHRILDKSDEVEVLRVIEDLKYQNSQEMEEDIQLQNKRKWEKYIKSSALPILIKMTSQYMFERVFAGNEWEPERAQLKIVDKEMFDEEILPGKLNTILFLLFLEFYSFIKYFRDRLFHYELYRKQIEVTQKRLEKLATKCKLMLLLSF